ncbi:Uncharacterized protein GBIM_17577 [Gryllus bimaculatus]|nr:Uncharacterized protein GBIM_17577 [Gryllus bimaculatus]
MSEGGLEYETIIQDGPKKADMSTFVDTEAIQAAYNDVRSDTSETEWAVFKFDGSRIVCAATGKEFENFRSLFGDDDRAFGYIRVQTGDEMSKRQKFLFLTWVGPGVGVIKRAKMSTDKAVVKNIVVNFAVELQLETKNDFDMQYFKDQLARAGGANYGTGERDM